MKKSMGNFMKDLKKNPYLDGYDVQSIFGLFVEPINENAQILFFEYSLGDYEGYAMGLYYDKKQKKYFEVYGSHCSCYGLEGQWEPGELNMAALELRFNEGHFYGSGGTLKNMYDEYMKA